MSGDTYTLILECGHSLPGRSLDRRCRSCSGSGCTGFEPGLGICPDSWDRCEDCNGTGRQLPRTIGCPSCRRDVVVQDADREPLPC